jgi:hypothetical protein
VGENDDGIETQIDLTSSLSEDEAKCLIRVNPNEDATNGFFVACLQRRSGQKSKKKVSSGTTLQRLIWKPPADNVPFGMELYDNHFDNRKDIDLKVEKVKPANEEEGASPNGESVDKAPSSKTAKRKANEVVYRQSSTNSTSASEICKKQAKKAEWKKQQRLKKELRLKRRKIIDD